jgi:hypothetical protein
MPICGRDMMNRTNHVMVKWKAANVSCACCNVASENMALFVNTWRPNTLVFCVTEQDIGKHTIPMVARVLTAIQRTAGVVLLPRPSPTTCSFCGFSSITRSTSPPTPPSSGRGRFAMLTSTEASRGLFSFSEWENGSGDIGGWAIAFVTIIHEIGEETRRMIDIFDRIA